MSRSAIPAEAPAGERPGVNPIRDHRAEIVTAAVVALGFFVLYLAIGEAYRTLPGYATNSNIFFGADHRDALRGWVPDHKGSHPILPLLLVPASAALARLLGSYEGGVVVLAAGFGALAAAVFFVLARALTGRIVVATGATAFYGLSMSQLVFGCIPESYGPAAAGLISTYVLTFWCLRERRLYLPLWVAAGLLNFGITMTNAVQTFVCLSVVLAGGVERGRRARLLVALPLVVVGMSVVLALAQKALFPQARLFFEPATYAYEFHYVAAEALDDPGYVAGEILKSFFVFNFIGQWPEIVQFEPGRRLVMVVFGAPVRFALLPTAAALLWIGLLVRGIVLGAGDRTARPVLLAAGVSVLANMALHAFYSTDELFLFTPNFTFAVLLLALGARSARGVPVAFAWWALAALAGANNLVLVSRIITRFGT